MRCDQFMGLPPEAEQFLSEYAVKPTVCECCKQEIPVERKVFGHYDGMFNDPHPLYRIPLTTGYAVEFLQATPWSRFPVFFHGLRVYQWWSNKLLLEFTWTDEEIEAAC